MDHRWRRKRRRSARVQSRMGTFDRRTVRARRYALLRKAARRSSCSDWRLERLAAAARLQEGRSRRRMAIGPACSRFPAVSNAPLGTVVSVSGDGVYRVAGHANSKTGVIFWLIPFQGQERAIAIEHRSEE